MQKLKQFLVALIILTMSQASFAIGAFTPNNLENVYLNAEVSNQSVQPILKDVQELEPNQTLFIHINSPGGSVAAGQILVDAIHKSRGKVVAVLDGLCASMAVDIALACSDVQIGDAGKHEGGTVLVKNSNYSVSAKDAGDLVVIHACFVEVGMFSVHDVDKSMADSHQHQIDEYKPILTKAEQDKVFKDYADVAMTSAQFVQRVHHHIN